MGASPKAQPYLTQRPHGGRLKASTTAVGGRQSGPMRFGSVWPWQGHSGPSAAPKRYVKTMIIDTQTRSEAVSEMSANQLALIAHREGASELFVSYLLTDDPSSNRHLGRDKVKTCLMLNRSLPGAWGGFMSACWDGNVEKATQRADASNTRILRDIDTSDA